MVSAYGLGLTHCNFLPWLILSVKTWFFLYLFLSIFVLHSCFIQLVFFVFRQIWQVFTPRYIYTGEASSVSKQCRCSLTVCVCVCVSFFLSFFFILISFQMYVLFKHNYLGNTFIYLLKKKRQPTYQLNFQHERKKI